MQQNRDTLHEQLTSGAWSLNDPIERLHLKPVVTGTLHSYGVWTLEDLLQLPNKPQYENMPESAFREIDPVIEQVRQLLKQEALGFEEAEDAPPKTQQASKCRDLDGQITSLEQTFAQLGIQLSQTARELADLGSLPSDKIIEDLTAARVDFVDLRSRVLELANFVAVSPLPKSDEIVTLQELRLLLQAAVQAEERKAAVEQIRQRALTILERVLTIVHRNRNYFLPLVECKTQAHNLRYAIAEPHGSTLHPDTEILAEGKHPFALLLILIEQWRELSEDHWGLLKATVEHSFGQSLSVEAARGNLIIPGEVAVTITSAVPEKGDGIARPIESPASSVEISEDISPKSQMIPKNAGAVIPPIAEMTQSLPEVRNREISSSQEKTRHLSKEGKSS